MTTTTASASASYRVVVVGAGIAGLTAARELVQSGRVRLDEICVLEAASRIGGRVHSVPFGMHKRIPVELGAAWIHGASEDNRFFRDLIQRVGIAYKTISSRNPWLHPASCPGFELFDGSDALSEDEVAYTWRLCDALLSALQSHANDEESAAVFKGKSLSDIIEVMVSSQTNAALAARLAEHTRSKKCITFCVRLIEIWMGVAADLLQLDDFEDVDLIGDDPGAHCIIPHGMEQVIEYLAAPLAGAIQLNSAVQTVNYSTPNEGVVLDLVDGRVIQAGHVVMTCSLGYLAANNIHFVPELPVSKSKAIKSSSMGQYMKILVEFPCVFWPKDSQFLGQLAPALPTQDSGNAPPPTIEFPLLFNYYSAKGVAVLEGVLIGDAALDASELEDTVIVEQFVRHVERMFGTRVPAPVGHLITRWNKDPWAVGAYSCLTVESSVDDPEYLRKTVLGRVLFAGEATNYRYQGALQAAYLSGLAAVDELDSLGATTPGLSVEN